MSWLDAVLIIPLVYGLFHGFHVGAVNELVAVVAVVLGVLAAKFFGAPLSDFIQHPTRWPLAITNVLAYLILFVIMGSIVQLCGDMISNILHFLHLGCLNHFVGAICGLLAWFIILLSILFFVDSLDQQYHFVSSSIKQASILYLPLVHWANDLLSFIRF